MKTLALAGAIIACFCFANTTRITDEKRFNRLLPVLNSTIAALERGIIPWKQREVEFNEFVKTSLTNAYGLTRNFTAALHELVNKAPAALKPYLTEKAELNLQSAIALSGTRRDSGYKNLIKAIHDNLIRVRSIAVDISKMVMINVGMPSFFVTKFSIFVLGYNNIVENMQQKIGLTVGQSSTIKRKRPHN